MWFTMMEQLFFHPLIQFHQTMHLVTGDHAGFPVAVEYCFDLVHHQIMLHKDN